MNGFVVALTADQIWPSDGGGRFEGLADPSGHSMAKTRLLTSQIPSATHRFTQA